jgi:hypothetical protein
MTAMRTSARGATRDAYVSESSGSPAITGHGWPENDRHDLVLAHPSIGKKAVSRLGVGPILTGIRNTFADSRGHHPQQFTEPLGQPHILKTAPCHFIVYPAAGGRGVGHFLCLRGRSIGSHPNYPPQLSLFIHFIRNKSSPSTKYLWVIERRGEPLTCEKTGGKSRENNAFHVRDDTAWSTLHKIKSLHCLVEGPVHQFQSFHTCLGRSFGILQFKIAGSKQADIRVWVFQGVDEGLGDGSIQRVRRLQVLSYVPQGCHRPAPYESRRKQSICVSF